jgi:O-antigen biosynthesis protein
MRLVDERLSMSSRIAPWLRYQHETRYAWAAPICRGKRTLDGACGTGYGAALLADGGAARVVAVDVAVEVVVAVSVTQRRFNAAFACTSVTELAFPGGTFDVVVSLETIEHVTDDERYVDEMSRVLRPDGLLICSTPNREVTNPGTRLDARPFNPFHVREYAPVELATLLSRRVSEVTLYGQTPFRSSYVSALDRVGRVAPRVATRLHQVRKVLGAPWDRRERHAPFALSVGASTTPEVLIALCRHPIAS